MSLSKPAPECIGPEQSKSSLPRNHPAAKGLMCSEKAWCPNGGAWSFGGGKMTSRNGVNEVAASTRAANEFLRESPAFPSYPTASL
jgi:hypothetical protein